MIATVTFLQLTQDSADNSTYNKTGVNFGTAAADRRIHIAGAARSSDGGARTISSVTIGGVAATINNQLDNSGSIVWNAVAAVPTGTSGTIDLVFSGTMGNCDFGSFASYGVVSSTASDGSTSTANPGTFDLDIPAGGIAIAISSVDVGGATQTWAGLTERWDGLQSSGNDFSGASDAFATVQTNLTVSATRSSSSRPTYAVVSFGPLTAVTMPTTVGAFILTGIAAALSRALRMAVTVGVFVLTGIAATLTGLFRWTNRSKNSSSYSNRSKNSSSYSNRSKNASSWSNRNKS